MSKKEYEVFLSFIGSDTTTQVFIESLYYALNEAGVSVFKSYEDLIRPALIRPVFHALDNSKICVVLLSPTFACSEWCLFQVERMVNMNKHILPIFYGVTPKDVNLETDLYDSALEDHLMWQRRDTIQNWSVALKEISTRSGRQLRDKGLFIKFCGDITAEILWLLHQKYNSDINGLRQFIHRQLTEQLTTFMKFCKDGITEEMLGLTPYIPLLTRREYLTMEPQIKEVTIAYANQNNEGTSTLLSSTPPGDGTFQIKITSIPHDGPDHELCNIMEDHIKFLWHDKVIKPCFIDNKTKTVFFHGHYISVEKWCSNLYDIIKKYHDPKIHGEISVWWWKHAEDFIKLIARDVGIAMREVHQAGHYHGNIADGIFIGVKPSKLNDTVDPTYLQAGGFVYRDNTVETHWKTGYIGNFRRHDETVIDRNQAEDVAAFYKILVYMITYADVREETQGFRPLDELNTRNISDLIAYGKTRLECLAEQLAKPAKQLAEAEKQSAEDAKQLAEAVKQSAEDAKQLAEAATQSVNAEAQSAEAKQAKRRLVKAEKQLEKAKKKLAKADERLENAQKQLAKTQEMVFLGDLKSFLWCMGQQVVRTNSTEGKVSFPMGWIFGHPYLFNASDALHFVDNLSNFIFEQLDKGVRKYVKRKYNPDNLANWNDRATSSTMVNHAYKYEKVQPGETIPKCYKSAISSIKAFRHTVEHHCKKLPDRERREKRDVVKEILKDFNILPDIFESMEDLINTLLEYEDLNQKSTSAKARKIPYDAKLFTMLRRNLRSGDDD